ncbi:potassium-transporting ATPase subunit C [uncultured Adlercreutzia sp.]|uniref:potassium-transporting ATPase subunit C n=1 Tax=uncultured Adlercreutzia sp. TaxID=875803 RepID=UPI0025D7D7A0|nr:potassium-transporting ATPase subunit C [uncultured Adlercreutzia sp.]
MKANGVGSALGRATALFLVATLALGIVYPVAMCGLAAVAFPWQATGSVIEVDGVKYGSALVGQPFAEPGHLWGRPTVADAGIFTAQDGSPLLWYGPENLSPASDEFAERVQARVESVRAATPEAGDEPVPSDLVTVSGSGFDPHISPAAAEYQVGRIARATGRSEDEVRSIIRGCTERPLLGVIGEARVNVLEANLMLDGVLDAPPNR